MTARTRTVRTRLNEKEEAKFLADAQKAGKVPAEYLRDLIVGPTDDEILVRLASIEKRLEHVETQVADMWIREGHREKQAQ